MSCLSSSFKCKIKITAPQVLAEVKGKGRLQWRNCRGVEQLLSPTPKSIFRKQIVQEINRWQK